MAFGDFVQQANNFASADGTTLAVAAFNAAAGNLVVVATSFDTGTERTITVSDDVDGDYAQAITLFVTAENRQVAIHYKVIATGGARTITQSISTGGTFRHLGVGEYAGPVGATPLDKTAAALDTTADPAVGPVTPDSNGQLIFGMIGNAGGAVYAAAGGFTERIEWGDKAQFQDLVQATAASISSSWTANAANHVAAMATFRAGGAAPTPPPVGSLSSLGVGR